MSPFFVQTSQFDYDHQETFAELSDSDIEDMWAPPSSSPPQWADSDVTTLLESDHEIEYAWAPGYASSSSSSSTSWSQWTDSDATTLLGNESDMPVEVDSSSSAAAVAGEEEEGDSSIYRTTGQILSQPDSVYEDRQAINTVLDECLEQCDRADAEILAFMIVLEEYAEREETAMEELWRDDVENDADVEDDTDDEEEQEEEDSGRRCWLRGGNDGDEDGDKNEDEEENDGESADGGEDEHVVWGHDLDNGIPPNIFKVLSGTSPNKKVDLVVVRKALSELETLFLRNNPEADTSEHSSDNESPLRGRCFYCGRNHLAVQLYDILLSWIRADSHKMQKPWKLSETPFKIAEDDTADPDPEPSLASQLNCLKLYARSGCSSTFARNVVVHRKRRANDT